MKEQIDWERLKKGASLCLRNSGRLIYDAGHLFRAKSYSSSILLAIYSIEEAGKALLCLDYFQRGRDVTEECWRYEFKEHVFKIFKTYEGMFQEAINRDPLDNMLRQIAKKVQWAGDQNTFYKALSKTLNDWKKQSIYMDYDFKKGEWIEPTKIQSIESLDIGLERLARGIICQALLIILSVEKRLEGRVINLGDFDDIYIVT